jgi:hypothetical protein
VLSERLTGFATGENEVVFAAFEPHHLAEDRQSITISSRPRMRQAVSVRTLQIGSSTRSRTAVSFAACIGNAPISAKT